MIRHVIFDLGGVLRKLGNFDAFYGYLSRNSPRLDAARYKSLWRLFTGLECGRVTFRKIYSYLLRSCGFRRSYSSLLSRFSSLVHQNPLPGRQALIRHLASRNYKVHLLSNTSSVHFAPLVRKRRMFRNFTRLFVSYRLGLMKPDRRIYTHVTRVLKAKPCEIIFIDDTEANIRAAERSGWVTLKVRRNRPFASRLLRILS